ncbi:MAG: 4Fe-4S binding protein, partial [Oscillospiraceae bacterium]|nr:4Fe-4S binding protein [Oscillospiraceae bacterium]
GIGTCTEENIEVVTLNGECQEETLSKDELFRRMGNPDFDVPRDGSGSFLSVFSRVVTKLSRPKIDRSKCVHCGVCVGHCPVPGGAVHFDNGRDRPPVYDYGKCIRCYCCQELCPAEAIRKRIL